MIYETPLQVTMAFAVAHIQNRNLKEAVACFSSNAVCFGSANTEFARGKDEIKKRISAETDKIPAGCEVEISDTAETMFTGICGCASCRVNIREPFSGITYSVRLIASCVKTGKSFLIGSLSMVLPRELLQPAQKTNTLSDDDERRKHNNDFFDSSLLTGWVRCKSDINFTISFMNHYLIGLLGYGSKEDMMEACGGHYAAFMAHDSSVDEVIKESLSLPVNGNTVFTYSLRTKSGGRIWIREHCHKYSEPDGTQMLLCLCINITDIVNLENSFNHQQSVIESANAQLKSAEEAVRIYEEEAQLAMSQAGKALYLYNIPERTLDISPRSAEIFNVDTKHIQNVPESLFELDVFAPESIEAVTELNRRIISGEKSGNTIVVGIDSSGLKRWYNVSFNTVFDNCGRPFSSVIALQDITDERGEQIMGELDRVLLLTALRSAYPISISLNLSQGTYKILAGKEYLAPKSAFKGHIDDLSKSNFWVYKPIFPKEYISQFKVASLIKRLTNGPGFVRFEFLLKLPNDISHWVELSIYLTENPYGSDIIGIAMLHYIDEQKETQRRLQEALDAASNELGKERRYQQLIDASTPLCTVICKLRGDNTLLHVGGTLLSDLGYTDEDFFEIHRNRLQGFVIEEDYAQTMAYIMQVASTLQPEYEHEFRVYKKNGDIAWIFERGTLTYVEDNEPAYISVYIDITQRKKLDDSLRISSEINRLSIAQPGKLVCIYDIAMLTLTVPEEFAAKHGFPSAVMPDVPYCSREMGMLSEEYIDSYSSFYEGIIHGEKSGTFEYKVKIADGSWAWEKIEFVTIFDAEGTPVKAVIYVSDTTRLHRADVESEILRELVRGSVMYYRANLSTQMIEEYRSPNPDEPLVTKPFRIEDEMRETTLSAVEPEYRDAVKNTLFADSLMHLYERGESSVSLLYRRWMPGMGLRWLMGYSTITRNPDTNEIFALTYCKDVDDEHKAAIAIESALDEELESVIILNIGSGFARVVKSSSHFDDFIKGNMNFDTLMTRIVELYVVPADRKKAKDFVLSHNLIRSLRAEPNISVSFRIITNDGRVCRKTMRAFYLDETREDIVISRSDVTDIYYEEQMKNQLLQDAVDAANEASRAKSEFISRMSHDIRTPLNAILSLSGEELTAEATGEMKDDYLEKIHSSGEYLLGIINDVLDMSRIESKKIVLRPEPYSLDDFADTIDTVIGEQCRRKGIDFAFNIPNAPKKWVMLDRVHINQVFINLLSNSVKFTPAGGRIDFTIEHIDETDTHISDRFIVRDNGIGMAKDFIPHAFESFTQEKRLTTSENNQGTGLGLTIVKQIVDIMGGTITLQSEPGVGTVFVVELSIPIATAPDLEENDPMSGDVLTGRRILLCEDHPLNAEIAAALLEKKGCIVEIAENGRIGLDMFNRSSPGYYSLVLMDIRMPVMDGLEATKAIRASRHPDSHYIPIVALTADAFSKDAQISREAGMNGHLSKPIEPKLLYEIISKQIASYENLT